MKMHIGRTALQRHFSFPVASCVMLHSNTVGHKLEQWHVSSVWHCPHSPYHCRKCCKHSLLQG